MLKCACVCAWWRMYMYCYVYIWLIYVLYYDVCFDAIHCTFYIQKNISLLMSLLLALLHLVTAAFEMSLIGFFLHYCYHVTLPCDLSMLQLCQMCFVCACFPFRISDLKPYLYSICDFAAKSYINMILLYLRSI